MNIGLKTVLKWVPLNVILEVICCVLIYWQMSLDEDYFAPLNGRFAFIGAVIYTLRDQIVHLIRMKKDDAPE